MHLSIDSAGFSPLTQAVSIGDDATVQFLLETGSDPNELDSSNRCALTIAVLNKHLKSASFLMEYGADPHVIDSTGKSPLAHAKQTKDAEFIALLGGAPEPVQPATSARSESRPPVSVRNRMRRVGWSVRNVILYTAGIGLAIGAVELKLTYSERARLSIFDAIAADDVTKVGRDLTSGISANTRDASGTSILQYAAVNGKADVVRLLLKNHADPNLGSPSGITLLGLTGIEHPEIVDNLLDEGADPNRTDQHGRTLLAYACSSTRFGGVISRLIKHHANPNVAGDNGPPLVTLIEQGEGVDPDSVQMLLTAGANPNAADSAGTPVLIWASQNSTRRIVDLLLEAKANISAKDAIGRTALMAAARGHRTDILKILVEHQADVHAIDNSGANAIRWALAGMADGTPEALSGGEDAIRILYRAGVSPTQPDHAGLKPIDWARQQGISRGVSALASNGGE